MDISSSTCSEANTRVINNYTKNTIITHRTDNDANDLKQFLLSGTINSHIDHENMLNQHYDFMIAYRKVHNKDLDKPVKVDVYYAESKKILFTIDLSAFKGIPESYKAETVTEHRMKL